jgi:UDP-N-acetylglucosamine acyltransferase
MSEYHHSNRIHPTAVIDSSVKIGMNNTIGPYTMIGPDVEIGDFNHFYGMASIGFEAQHREKFRNTKPVIIGSDNVFREYVTVHAPTTGETRIGDGCYFMACSHISHDTIIEDGVTMANNVLLGGKSYVMRGANLGLGAVVHQYSVIGSWAMIGMGAVITKGCHVFPGHTYAGNPAYLLKQNEVGLKRAQVSKEMLAEEQQRWLKLLGHE